MGSSSQSEINQLIQGFSSAPVSNPNNERGINLHLYSGEEVAMPRTIDLQTYYENYYRTSDTFSTKDRGFYHAVIVEEVSGDSSVGVTSEDELNGVLVQKREEDRTGSTLMHELGHQLGLVPTIYYGVDSTDNSWEEYPSVMNYNSPTYCDTWWIFEYNMHK